MLPEKLLPFFFCPASYLGNLPPRKLPSSLCLIMPLQIKGSSPDLTSDSTAQSQGLDSIAVLILHQLLTVHGHSCPVPQPHGCYF